MGVSKAVHLIGIGGAGMSAIARVLLSQGVHVSGSDIAETPVVRELRRLGAHVAIGHRAGNVDGVDEVVLSSAIRADNPEVQQARSRSIPVRHRSEVLAQLLNERQGIAVAGAHGKTTVTSMLAWTLDRLDQRPTFLIGGELPDIGGAKYGSGPLLVAEADESDRSFLRYKPYIAIVTSIEPDHLENYDGSFDTLKESYVQFLENVKPHGRAVLCIDDPTVDRVSDQMAASGKTVVRYGFGETASYRATNVRSEGFHTTFDVSRDREAFGSYTLGVPGRHNVQNALACIVTCDGLNVDRAGVRTELAEFRGALRRFEVVGEKNGILIVDDYAHHPSEIQATLRACKAGWDRRVVAVFQPHRYSRTGQLMEEFARCFSLADLLVLTEVYAPAPEEPLPGVSGRRLAELTTAQMGKKVAFVPTLDEVVDHLCRVTRPGDIVLTMGAGDVWKAAHALAQRES